MDQSQQSNQMDYEYQYSQITLIPDRTEQLLQKYLYNSQQDDQKTKQIAQTPNIGKGQNENKPNLATKQTKRQQSDNSQLSSQLPQDFSNFNESLQNKKSKEIQSQMSQDSQATVNLKQSRPLNEQQQQTWQLGDIVFTRDDIKGCFSDKQIFNQANIFTRKHLNDLFEDSDDEVQEEGLVTQIHKRNMQDVYDMTPKDKKFTFLWNEFFIKLEKQKIKEKIPIKRSDMYGYIQQFMDENIQELINLHPQFVIHLFTMQDNGILDSEQIARCLKYLKDYPAQQVSFMQSQ
ncbi:polycomb protein VEFS-box protein (macronuclear) [Tetrahymena thermophila SB210]|uniref:Polycomb protein VEFS-box protein n=1 Tax=Tetrahymena thermophila (strain SB210) TaxID=312017 RepID=Q23E51_TETTS|nr:polycomb protein VEFS-box protein [Tetrahymena thermophila SB210]EAR94736.1 polycomb protein VEFS-box protein [Tetrahymena thermophila SB210]|eukprot:XP_001014981.1 polycomb protein VEFS-box protein [Tetrahymena thermophila SB210]